MDASCIGHTDFFLDLIEKFAQRAAMKDAITKMKSHARVALHFHPDRPDPTMNTVAKAMLEQGIYTSQFETLLSSGSVSAYPGGEQSEYQPAGK